MLKSYPIKVGITIGDPSGIGPAITFKALSQLKGLADFVVVGDKWVFNRTQSVKCKAQNFEFVDLDNVAHKNFAFGKVKAEYGRASIEYLDKALGLIYRRKIDCLVTCPISKEAVNLAGLRFSGHTEYLASYAKRKDFVMMLLNKDLKFSLITRHIPLKDVPREINEYKIYKTILLTDAALKRLFLINKPRMVVCGLNPHASDNGVIGNEENNIIKPALKKIRAKLHTPIDLLPSDIAILKAKEGVYDCVIAIYHDQALIPLKLSGKESGVNLTLGLPFVRTSPLHGTAFDIAQRPNLASPASLAEAIKLAIKCASNLKKV